MPHQYTCISVMNLHQIMIFHQNDAISSKCFQMQILRLTRQWLHAKDLHSWNRKGCQYLECQRVVNKDVKDRTCCQQKSFDIFRCYYFLKMFFWRKSLSPFFLWISPVWASQIKDTCLFVPLLDYFSSKVSKSLTRVVQ